MQRIARILYDGFLDDKRNVAIGGAQNYVLNLSKVLLSMGIKPIVYQSAKEEFSTKIDGCEVKGVPNSGFSRALVRYIDQDNPNYKDDLLIFGTDFMICRNRFKHSIAIQHGVAWDITEDERVSDLRNTAAIFKNTLRALKKYSRYRNCNNIVCVDYNFINWYRTQVAHVNENCIIIPNFAVAADKPRKRTEGKVSIIFARRLIDYRGTRLFAEAVIPLLEKYPDITVTVAGTGPDEQWMKTRFGAYRNVAFTSFKAEDSVRFHADYDIAVVPTKGSEGTSLSLLEAMSAGCVPIATNVGGMTNIILDGYNGRLINPDVNELREVLEELINDKDQRARLAAHAVDTARESFSYEKWAESWKQVIKRILSE